MAREMKDSGVAWIGEIPAEWSIVKIKAGVTKVGSGKTPSGGATTYTDEGVLFLRSQNIYDTGLELSNPTYITPEVDEEMKGTRVFPNDVLLNITGGSIGRCCIFPESLKMANVNQHVSIIRVNRDVFLPEYMHYYWISPLGSLAIDLYQTGGNREGMSAEAIKNTPIILIPLDEQCRICKALDNECSKIDAVLEKTRTSIEEYKKLKQAIITQAVTKGVRGDRPMKESGIEWVGEVPADWSINLVFQLFRQVKNKNDGMKESNLLSLSYGRIKQRSIDAVEGLLPETFEGYNIIEANDIVLRLTDLQNDQTSLRVGLSTERGIVTSAYLTIRNLDGNIVKYLYYFLHAFDISKGFYGMGGGVRQGLNWDGVKDIKIAIPPIDEQREISEYLDAKCDAIDYLIAQKQRLVVNLDAFKKSLIYEYVTGKKVIQQEQQIKEVIVSPFFPAVFQASKPRFAQAILMSKVLDSCRIKMGRVKLEKMMFVLENSIGFDFDTKYEREAAGPFDRSIYECERIISRKNKWFTIRESQHGVSYKPTTEYSKYKKYFAQYFGSYEDAIDKVIAIFNDFDADQSEVIATLYGAWNDFIIDKRSYTDNDIVDEVLNHWHPKKRRFPRDMWLRAIQKMRDFGLVPHGYGRHTVIKEKNYG